MAEEEDKKNQQNNSAQPAKNQGGKSVSGNQGNPKKKRRRRRPRRRKKTQTERAQSKNEVSESKITDQLPTEGAQQTDKPKKEEESGIVAQLPEKEKLADEDIFEVEEEALVEEEAPEIKTEIETGIEEKYLASDDTTEPTETVEVQPPPELPEEISPAASEPSGANEKSEAEKPQEPVGWDQLKDAIKKDHEKSEQQIAEGITPVPVPVSEAPEEVQPEPIAEPETVEPETVEPEAVEPEAVEPEAVEPEAVEPEPVPVAEAPSGDLTADEDAEKQEIIRIIVKYAIGGCAVIVIVAGIFLFKVPQLIIELSQNLLSGGETKQEQQIEDPVTDIKPEPDSTRPDSDIKDGTGTALISGSQIPRIRKVPASIQTLFKIGIPEILTSDSDTITTYLQVLNELQNGFETDINQLLDNSNNRANAIDIHLRELNGLFAEAKFTYENLNEEKDEIKIQFNKVTAEKNTLEEAFFVSLDKLQSNESNQILNNFIETSKDQIKLKAEFNALSKISGMFDRAMKNMEARIKDIQANKAALVKGVKVVDIKGSDLDLIIQEGEL